MTRRTALKSCDQTILEAAKYSVVGGACTLLDMAILYALVRFFKFNYLVSSVISFSSGAVLNYFLCTTWIFHQRSISNRKIEFLMYIAITLVVLLINTIVIWFLTSLENFNYMTSKMVSVVITFFLNFLLRKFILHYNFIR